MKWFTKDLLKVSKETRRMFARHTPPGEDYMREGCQLSVNRREGSYIAVALFGDDNLLVGWAMLDFCLSRSPKSVRVYIFVRPKFRRQGFGTKILHKAKQKAAMMGRTIRVCPHNKTATKFFKSFRISRSEVVPGYTYAEGE